MRRITIEAWLFILAIGLNACTLPTLPTRLFGFIPLNKSEENKSGADQAAGAPPTPVAQPAYTGPMLPGVSLGQLAAFLRLGGPEAAALIQSIDSAQDRRHAERRSEETRQEEARQLRNVQTELYRADDCAAVAPLPLRPGKSRGGDDPAALDEKADRHFRGEEFDKAEPLLDRALELRRAKLAQKDPAVARSMNRLAVARLAREDYLGALSMARDGLTLRKAIHDEEMANKRGDGAAALPTPSLDLSESESTLATIYRALGDFEKARPLYEDALKRREHHLGADSLCTAQSQNHLGELEHALGHFEDARGLLERALATRQKKLGARHQDVAETLSGVASIYQAVGLFQEAEKRYQAALSIRMSRGADHPDVARSKHDLAGMYLQRRDYAQAVVLYKDAWIILDRRRPQSLELARTDAALGGLYLSLGDLRQAGDLLEEARKIREQRLAGRTDHPDLAASYADLGRLTLLRAQAEGDAAGRAALLKTAAAHADKALQMRKRRFGPNHPIVAQSLDERGEVAQLSGDRDQAKQLYAEALQARKQRLGGKYPNHPEIGASHHHLAVLAQETGNLVEAEREHREALRIRQNGLGSDHPALIESRLHLGALLLTCGRAAEALSLLDLALSGSEELLRVVGVGSGEAGMDMLLRSLREQEDVAYSLLLDENRKLLAEPERRRALQLAMKTALLRKGRSVDEAARISQAVHVPRGTDDKTKKEIQRLSAELHIVRRELAHMNLSGTKDAAVARKKGDEERRLARELAQRTNGSAVLRPGADQIVGEVTRVLAADKGASKRALLEFVGVHPRSFQAGPRRAASEPRYLAMVLNAAGEIQAADLGTQAVIDGGIADYRRIVVIAPAAKGPPGGAPKKSAGLAPQKTAASAATPPCAEKDPARCPSRGPSGMVSAGSLLSGEDQERLAAEIYKRVMKPLAGLLGDTRDLYVAPDGWLNLLPLDALYHGGDYLLEQFDQISYLTSGRDLLPRGAADPVSSVALLGLKDVQQGAGRQALKGGKRRLPGGKIPNLPGAIEEINEINRHIPGTLDRILLTGRGATKDKFLALIGPGVLHVATHGFLLEPPGAPKAGAAAPGGPASRGPGDAVLVASSEDPMLRSVLALSGALTPEGFVVPDGMATALEVADMDLWGTRLVVLSACVSGTGDVSQPGHGVYGLRRAVMAAGAETLVATQWTVDDEATRKLMAAFYERLSQGQGRAAALRQAQRDMKRAGAPVGKWAPFVLIGDRASLPGLKR